MSYCRLVTLPKLGPITFFIRGGREPTPAGSVLAPEGYFAVGSAWLWEHCLATPAAHEVTSFVLDLHTLPSDTWNQCHLVGYVLCARIVPSSHVAAFSWVSVLASAPGT